MSYLYMSNQDTRFMERDEMYKVSKKVCLDDKESTFAGPPISSDGKVMYVLAGDTNVMTIGEPGSGKSDSLVYATVLSIINKGESIILNDPKAETLKGTYNLLKTKGYDVIVINFRSNKSYQYNPLYYPAVLWNNGEKGEAVELVMDLAESLFKQIASKDDPFWHQSSAQLFVGLSLLSMELNKEEDVTIDSVYNLYLDGQNKIGSRTVLKEYMEEINDEPLIERALNGVINAPSDTLMSIYACFSAVMQKLVVNEKLKRILSGRGVEPEDIVGRKTAIFFVTRDETSTYDAIIATMIDQIYGRLINYAEATGGRLQREVAFVLDEFSSLYIPDVNTKVSAARSRGIRFFLYIQSLAQLTHIYGESLAKIILGCCQHVYYTHSNDIAILEWMEKLIGNYITQYTRVSRPLISSSRLRHLKLGEMVVLINRQFPLVTHLPPKKDYLNKLGIEELSLIPEPDEEKIYIPNDDVSIKRIVEEYREKKMKEFLDKSQRGELKNELVPDPRYLATGLNIEEIVSRIDQKIEELEKEERREKEGEELPFN